MLGDKLVRVDGVDCMGLVRDDIKRRVLGHADSKIVLEFQRASIFKVKMRRTPAVPNVPKALSDDRNSPARQKMKDSLAHRDRRIHATISME